MVDHSKVKLGDIIVYSALVNGIVYIGIVLSHEDKNTEYSFEVLDIAQSDIINKEDFSIDTYRLRKDDPIYTIVESTKLNIEDIIDKTIHKYPSFFI